MDPRNLTADQLDQLRRSTGYTKARLRSGLGVVYFTAPDARGHVTAKGYQGKAAKPAWHYRFSTPERLAAHVARWDEKLQAVEQAKVDRRAQRKAEGHRLQVGDVLRASWGYEQTNIDYFQVTRVSAASVWIRPIAQDSREDQGWLRGSCVPVKGRFTGPETMRRASGDGVRIKSFMWASKVEPICVAGVEVFKPDSWTAYA